MTCKYQHYLKSAGLAALILGSFYPAYAQDMQEAGGQSAAPVAQAPQPAPALADNSDAQTGETGADIIVTGSSIRGAPAVGSNLISVGRDVIEDSAVQTVQQLLQTVPAIWGSNAAPQGGFASNDASGTSVPQIHGLGGSNSSSTLVVIDGHRFPLSGVRRNLPDPGFIPPNALERVEVLAEGASSIYGSDAVAGVLNFITRRRFSGVEASTQFGFGDDYKTKNASIAAGQRWGTGGMAVFYNFSDRGDLRGADRPLTLPDQRARGGRNFSNFNCGPTSFQPQGSQLIYLYPYGGTGIQNVPDNAPCEQASSGSLIPQEIRHSLMVKLDQQVGDRLTLNADVVFSNRRNIARSGVGGNIQATVFGAGSGMGGQINPFFVAPAGTGATRGTVRFSGNELFPDGSRSVAVIENFYGYGNAEYKLSDDWTLTGFLMAGNSTSSETITGQLCSSCLLLALNGTTNSNGSLTQPSIPGTNQIVLNTPLTVANAVDLWNPRATNRTSAAVLARLQDSRNYQRTRQGIQQYNLKLDGSLFALPAGDVKVALGGDIVKLSVDSEVAESNNTGPSSTGSSYNAYLYKRTVQSVYAEALIPVISPEMEVPFARRIDLNISGRYDHYSDFGNIKNPKFAANWEIVEGVKLRGNYAESFVAPQFSTYGPDELTGIDGLSVDSFFGPRNGSLNVPLDRYPEARAIPGCNTPGQVTCQLGTAGIPGMQIDGANPDVKPSKGMAWAIGADFAPRFLPGLTASLTFWHNTLEGASGSPPLTIVINSTAFHDLLRIYPTGATAAEIEEYRGGRRQRAPLASGPIYFGLDFRNFNVYTVKVEGIDFDVHYRHRFDWGSIRGGVAGTYKTRFDQTAADGEPVFSVLNKNRYNGTFPSIRTELRADLGVEVGPVSASVAANYTGSYTYWGTDAINGVTVTNGIPTGGGDKVKSYTTVDANLTYKFGDMLPGQPSVYVQVRNLFDAYPPFINTSTGFDNFLAFPLGRVVNVGLRVKF